MRKLFLLVGFIAAVFFVAPAPVVRAATGDIVSVTVQPAGWYADIAISGLAVGGTHAYGLGTNNDPATGTPKMTFTVVSLGYDDTGAATTLTRTIYGTLGVRFPYSTATINGTFSAGTFADGETATQGTSGAAAIIVNNQSAGAKLYVKTITGTPDNSHVWTGGTSGATFTASSTATTLTLPTNNEMFNGTNTIVRVALSEKIFSKDIAGAGIVANVSSGTAPVVSILSGWYTSSGTPNNASGASFAVTNSSTEAYPKVIGNWTWPSLDRVTGNFPLRCVAFHSSGRQGRPVRAVKFTAADAHSHTATTTVTAMTYDSTVGDAVPVVEYVGTMDVSTLTALDALTCNFIAYPWVGDSGAVMDSSAGTAQPTPLVGPITFINDKSNTYGVTVALIDPAGSDAGANTVYDIASYPGDASAYKFLTIGKAASAIAAYNNTNHSRNNVGGGIAYINPGSFSWTGITTTYGSGNPNTWLTITRSASATQANAIINAQSGNQNIRNMVKVQGITITATSGAGCFSGLSYLWIDQCVISSASGVPFYQNSVWHVTRCTVPTLSMGIRPFSTENAPVGICRGNNLQTATYQITAFVAIGNIKTDTADGPAFKDVITGSTAPALKNHILAYNRITATRASNALVEYWNATVNTSEGGAIVQNLWEHTGTGNQPALYLGADGTTTEHDNGLLWYNTVVGQRVNAGYNDIGSAAVNRKNWSEKNNLLEDDNIKSDTYSTNSLDGRRIGNWELLYGVGCSGISTAEVTGVGAPGQYLKEFIGLKSYQPASTGGQPPTSATNTTSFYSFINRQAGTSGGAGLGGGDYHLSSNSPVLNGVRDFLLPYDLAGETRSLTADNPGAYRQPPPSSSRFYFFFR